jgi:hypothetical protein
MRARHAGRRRVHVEGGGAASSNGGEPVPRACRAWRCARIRIELMSEI